MSKKSTVAVGDRVGYSRNFLKSMGGSYDIARRRATVVSVGKEVHGVPPIVTVRWDDMDEDSGVLSVNLARIGSAAFAD